MNIIAFVGAGIIGAVLSSVLKQYKPEFSIYITLITGMLMLGAAVSAVKPVIETVSGYLETAVPDSSYASVLVMYWLLLRVFGLAQVTEDFEEIGVVMLIVLLILGNVTFFLLDKLLEKRFVKHK